MLKTLAAQIKQYKKSTILTPIFAALEVVMEVLIPMAMARLVKYGIEGGDTGAIYRYGFLMMAMAMLSLVFGSVCAHTASHASTGFAANLRDGMYRNIQRFSFANIDKYSTAGLVTRMTTDVTNVQNAFQMITRIAVRSPLTLIFSMIVAFVINPELAGVFLIPLVLLGVVLGLIIKRATHLFDQVFKKYDDLNASVQENVSGIRVVKAFVREDFEDKKFGKAATNVYNLFVKAERIIAFNSPVMMLTIYGSVMALSWLGASLVTGGSLDVGDLTAMFTYVMNMLMNLMMLSILQCLMLLGFLLGGEQETIASVLMGFGGIFLSQWLLYIFYCMIRRKSFEVETMAFFLCTMGMAAIATVKPGETMKQLAAMALGVVTFLVIGWSLLYLLLAFILYMEN